MKAVFERLTDTDFRINNMNCFVFQKNLVLMYHAVFEDTAGLSTVLTLVCVSRDSNIMDSFVQV